MSHHQMACFPPSTTRQWYGTEVHLYTHIWAHSQTSLCSTKQKSTWGSPMLFVMYSATLIKLIQYCWLLGIRWEQTQHGLQGSQTDKNLIILIAWEIVAIDLRLCFLKKENASSIQRESATSRKLQNIHQIVSLESGFWWPQTVVFWQQQCIQQNMDY